MSGHPSTGEWAGIASAVVIVLGALGGGVWKLIRWADARAERRRRTRSDGLQEWEDKLSLREAQMDERTEARLLELEKRAATLMEQTAALRTSFELVAGALRGIDPDNPALRRAEQLLAQSFPLTAVLPPELGELVIQVDKAGAAQDARSRAKGGE